MESSILLGDLAIDAIRYPKKQHPGLLHNKWEVAWVLSSMILGLRPSSSFNLPSPDKEILDLGMAWHSFRVGDVPSYPRQVKAITVYNGS